MEWDREWDSLTVTPDSPLGRMMKFGDSLRPPPEITKEVLVKYCYITWPEQQLVKGYRWSSLGSDDTSISQHLCLYLTNTEKGLIKQECG